MMLNVPVHWRSVPLTERSPFACGEHGRGLRLVIDSDMPSAPALDLLRTFNRPLVETFETDTGRSCHVALGAVHEDRDMIEVNYVGTEDTHGMAVFAAKSWEKAARQAADEHGCTVEEAWRTLVLCPAAGRHNFDAFVTENKILFTGTGSSFGEKSNAMSADRAAGLLGLFLRAHNDYTVKQEGGHTTFLDSHRYYEATVRAALPDYAAWLAAAIARWRDGHPDCYSLLRGMITRLGRALRARDYFLVRTQHTRPDDTWRDALFFFESFLLFLSGGLDALARVVHLTYELPGSPFQAGWRKTGWLHELHKVDPVLGEKVEPGSRVHAAAELIGLPRNYIHGEALSSEMHFGEEQPTTIDYGLGGLAVPQQAGTRLIEAADHWGGADSWHLRAENFKDVVLLLPVPYANRVLSTTLGALREVMEVADPGRMGDAASVDLEPDYWLPGHEYASNLLLLSGFGSNVSWR